MFFIHIPYPTTIFGKTDSKTVKPQHHNATTPHRVKDDINFSAMAAMALANAPLVLLGGWNRYVCCTHF
jgi:hypothetical protein